MAVKPIPDGFHSVTAYLVVRGVPKLIDFLQRGLGGEELERTQMPDGTVMCAQVRIGDSIVMMGEAHGEHAPFPAMLYLYVHDTDALYRRALKAGATSIQEPVDMFYGDRNAGVKDPCGNQWWIATHKEDVSPEEVARRAAAHKK
ncbi:MAG TPA: VOC family protein [Planctomycetota bacterium]|jgi:uncharacterized glyoxalase superfamily protein PhnB|nr:VOC family protein [Planctomycetota bacterium]